MDRLAKQINSSKIIICLGVFDGIHRGHRTLIRTAIERARQIHGKSVAYTFDPHPVKVLAPQAYPRMINTVKQRVEILKSLGVQKVVVQNFTKKFSQKKPETFFREILQKKLKAQEIVVGYNFTFGVGRSGNSDTLVKLGKEANIAIHVIKPHFCHETLVSSTQVRKLLERADLSQANDLLGRPYFMEGKVVRGHGRGQKVLGIGTANLKSENDLLLPSGVYITETRIGSKTHRSLTNIGNNPTFGDSQVSIETHLLKNKSSLLGKKIRIFFLHKIREEIKFTSPQELTQQIQKDILHAQLFFKEKTR